MMSCEPLSPEAVDDLVRSLRLVQNRLDAGGEAICAAQLQQVIDTLLLKLPASDSGTADVHILPVRE